MKKLKRSKEKLSPGDLIFFEGHVGIYEGAGKMVHSSRSKNGVAVTDLTVNGQYTAFLQRSDNTIGTRKLTVSSQLPGKRTKFSYWG